MKRIAYSIYRCAKRIGFYVSDSFDALYDSLLISENKTNIHNPPTSGTFTQEKQKESAKKEDVKLEDRIK